MSDLLKEMHKGKQPVIKECHEFTFGGSSKTGSESVVSVGPCQMMDPKGEVCSVCESPRQEWLKGTCKSATHTMTRKQQMKYLNPAQ